MLGVLTPAGRSPERVKANPQPVRADWRPAAEAPDPDWTSMLWWAGLQRRRPEVQQSCSGPGWGPCGCEAGMAALRRHVFVGKVLKKLYPEVSHGQEKRAPVTPASRNPPEKVPPERVKGQSDPPETGGDTRVQPTRRLYTVGLPPEGWVPPPPEPLSCSSSESSSSSEDTGDQDLHNLPKRRRIRKHKSKKKFKNPNNIYVEPAESEKHQSLLQEKLQPRHTDGPTISKNKKRKLKKKQQMQRKKAAGSLTGASGVHFMYQPEEASSEQEDVPVTDGECAGGATGGGAAGAVEERILSLEEGRVLDAEEEEVKSTNKKADGILNFLRSTQEIYFYDDVSKDSNSGVFLESTNELFKQLENHSVSPSDVFILDHMKTLLLLHDTKRLKIALDLFPEHCRMPPEYARVITAFFNYWITHILPEKNDE